MDSCAAQPTAHTSALRFQLQSLSKGHQSVTEFLQEATSFMDQLAAIGEPLSINEYHTQLFRGLGAEFQDLDTAISVLTQTGSLTKDQLHALILNHERRLELASVTNNQPPPAAFQTSQGPPSSRQIRHGSNNYHADFN